MAKKKLSKQARQFLAELEVLLSLGSLYVTRDDKKGRLTIGSPSGHRFVTLTIKDRKKLKL